MAVRLKTAGLKEKKFIIKEDYEKLTEKLKKLVKVIIYLCFSNIYSYD